MDPLKIEFAELLKALGWSQAEAARQLGMTSGAVNQIVSPNYPSRPRETTMRLLKLMVASQRPGALHPETMQLREEAFTAEERNLIEQIRGLKEDDRRRVYQIINSVLATYQGKHPPPHKYPPHKPRGRIITSDKPSSRVADVLQKVEEQLPDVLAEEHARRERSPSSGAGEHGERKSQQAHGTHGHSGARRVSQGEAPKSRGGEAAGSHHKK